MRPSPFADGTGTDLSQGTYVLFGLRASKPSRGNGNDSLSYYWTCSMGSLSPNIHLQENILRRSMCASVLPYVCDRGGGDALRSPTEHLLPPSSRVCPLESHLSACSTKVDRNTQPQRLKFSGLHERDRACKRVSHHQVQSAGGQVLTTRTRSHESSGGSGKCR
ncbi:hypothetical protein BD309DRAFT_421694 [Dichomitus squalens]|nr:hypothetical protein BD309DRAFT_421694 [Dichomitus squalens]